MPFGRFKGRNNAAIDLNGQQNNISSQINIDAHNSTDEKALLITSNAKVVFKCRYCSKEYTQNGKWLAKHEENCSKQQPNKRTIAFLPTARNIPSNDFLSGFNISICHSNLDLDKSGSLLDDAFSVPCSNSEKANRSDLKSFECSPNISIARLF